MTTPRQATFPEKPQENLLDRLLWVVNVLQENILQTVLLSKEADAILQRVQSWCSGQAAPPAPSFMSGSSSPFRTESHESRAVEQTTTPLPPPVLGDQIEQALPETSLPNVDTGLYQPTDMTEGTGALLTTEPLPYVEELLEFTQKKCASVLFDSALDGLDAETLFRCVQNKPDVAVVALTEGPVFGAFYRQALQHQDEYVYDKNIMAFVRAAEDGFFVLCRNKRDKNTKNNIHVYTSAVNTNAMFQVGADSRGNVSIPKGGRTLVFQDFQNCFDNLPHDLSGSVTLRCHRVVALQLE